jgi:hypothetical protein
VTQRSAALTAAEFQVLLALADGEKHGYAIGKEIAAAAPILPPHHARAQGGGG